MPRGGSASFQPAPTVKNRRWSDRVERGYRRPDAAGERGEPREGSLRRGTRPRRVVRQRQDESPDFLTSEGLVDVRPTLKRRR